MELFLSNCWSYCPERKYLESRLGHGHAVVNSREDAVDHLVLDDLYRIHLKPSRSSHRSQNLALAFSFMKDEEELPILNICECQ